LCRYFGCTLGELAEYVPDESLTPDKPTPRKPAADGKSRAAPKKSGIVGRGGRVA
jgi:hypothetical protein